MSNDFFKFEEEGIDFPFYNGKPALSLSGWLILAIGLILKVAFIFGLWNYIPGAAELPLLVLSIIDVAVLVIPVAYCCRGKLGLIFRKPRLKDFKVILICVVGYYVFSIVMVQLLILLGLSTSTNPLGDMNLSALYLLVELLISLLGEELFKLMTLVMGMALAYHITQKRKTSMIIGIIVSCVLFGLIHLGTYNFNLVQCLLIIGLGCVIHFYPYLKTKNLVNSYITHVLIDAVIFLPLMMMGSI